MANHTFADRNRIVTGAADETGWSDTAPAANALVLPLGVRARSTGPGTEAAPVVFRGTFDGRYPITYAGLFATNLKQGDRIRLRLYADPAMTAVLFDSRPASGLDRRVIPSLYGWRQLRWGAANVFRGDLPPEDFALYPTNVHVVLPMVRAAAYRWDLVGSGAAPDPDDPDVATDAGYLEIGHAWFSDSLQVRIPPGYGAGYSDNWTPTDEITRTPGGGTFVEPGTGYRSVEIPLELIAKEDGDALFDQSKRVNWSKPVVSLPDVDDPAALFRRGFIGQRRDAFRKTWKHYGFDGATVQIEEITK
ncbi:hypothetical protein [Azospirillum sp. ST 5-10]|uniref:hypothetical protein n=1 Tax=unclassified Azospirillum TaxID=2630922 RepID=UPI003F4A0CE2